MPTAAGPLYEVDTRLRPSGADGLLAISLDTFADYQRDKAWTFEHMALTPRPPGLRLGGGTGPRSTAIVDDVLRLPRDPRAGRRRRGRGCALEIARHKPPKGPFDIKLVAGGLVDLEFAVHTLAALAPCRR